MNKVAALIVNYNMPERADALARHIVTNSVWPVDVYLIDNGSDQVEPANLTNVYVGKNVQTTRGWLSALQEIDQQQKAYFAFWFLITSAEFPYQRDYLTPMAEWLYDNPEAVGVHPALTLDSTTAWQHLYIRNPFVAMRQPRQTWMIDNIASLYRTTWFDMVGRFDPNLIYAWGIDLETCYKARQQGRSLWVDERVPVRKVTDIGYKMDRMGMTAQERRRLAGENMAAVLRHKYGARWRERMTQEYVSDEWR